MKFFYIPCPTKEIASKLASIILQKKLAFCANIYPEVTSLYFWNCEMQTDSETVLVLKTFSAIEGELVNEIKNHHPYKTPGIFSFSVSSLNPEYTQWARDQI